MLAFDMQQIRGQPGMSETLTQKENFPNNPTSPPPTKIPNRTCNIFELGMIC